MKAGHKSRNLVNVGGFFCRQDVSITIFGRTKEFSEVRDTSLRCNFGVCSRFLDVIYGVRLPNGSPASLVLVQPRKTRLCLTERLLMRRRESNQTKQKSLNKRTHYF